jgi:hypothetical protein
VLELASDGSMTLATTLQLPAVGGPITTAGFLDDSTIVAGGFFSASRLLLIHTNTLAFQSLGYLPLVGPAAPAFAVQQALQPRIAPRPLGDMIAVASRHAGRIDVYRIGTDSFRLAETPEPFDPIMRVSWGSAGARFVQDVNTRFGYIDVTATNHRIYGLYSGRQRSTHPGRAYMATTVHEYNWDGALLRTLTLDRDVLSITVDEAKNRLLAVIHEPAPGILSYSIAESP